MTFNEMCNRIGAAYHNGHDFEAALAAVQEATGWDKNKAEQAVIAEFINITGEDGWFETNDLLKPLTRTQLNALYAVLDEAQTLLG